MNGVLNCSYLMVGGQKPVTMVLMGGNLEMVLVVDEVYITDDLDN